MAADSTTIKSNAVIVRPHDFTYASTSTAGEISVNFNTFNLKLKHTCDHKLSTGAYRLASCPRCLGTGYYYDIKFNDVGKVTPINLTERLAQMLEKLALTDENRFHSQIAINVRKWLGQVPVSEIKAAIKFDIIKSLMIIQENQRGAPNLTGEVQIGRIDSVEVREDLNDPTRLFYIVKVTTISGVERELGGTVTLNNN